MSEEITLFDLPSQPPNRSWSGNAWKTRLALNFKGIPYKTEWIPYIHLQEKLKSLGLKPNPPGSWSEYSIPTVRFPDGTHMMDSAAIAKELEARYPTPSLKLNPDLEKDAQAALGEVFMALVPFLLMFAKNLVAPEDLDWFKADRAQRFGMTVEEAFETDRDPAPILEAAKPGFEKCRNVLRVHKVDQGPFILGSEASYADFYLVASTQMFNRAGERCWAEFSKAAPAELIELHDACRKWTARQD